MKRIIKITLDSCEECPCKEDYKCNIIDNFCKKCPLKHWDVSECDICTHASYDDCKRCKYIEEK